MNHLLNLLSSGRPCFPEELSSGDPPERHVYIELTVEALGEPERPLCVLEIGSWLGFSALTWAEALARRAGRGSVLCVDPWAPYHTPDDIRSLDYPLRMDAALRADVPYQLFLHNASQASEGVRVDHIRGRGANVLPYLRDAAFDIVYVDGSHYYADVVVDLREALRLTRSGGVICGDDLERQLGADDEARNICGVSQEEALRDDGTDTKLLPNERFYHPGVTRGVAEVLGRVTCWDGFFAVERSANGVRDLELEPGQPFLPRHFASGGAEMRRFIAAAAPWTRRRSAPLATSPPSAPTPPG